MATKPKPDDGAEPNRPMNRAKAQAYLFEKRLREASVFELSHGNRHRTNEDEIFEQMCVFRQMIENGLFKDIDEVESTVFGKWGMVFSVKNELVFGSTNPKGGG